MGVFWKSLLMLEVAISFLPIVGMWVMSLAMSLSVVYRIEWEVIGFIPLTVFGGVGLYGFIRLLDVALDYKAYSRQEIVRAYVMASMGILVILAAWRAWFGFAVIPALIWCFLTPVIVTFHMGFLTYRKTWNNDESLR